MFPELLPLSSPTDKGDRTTGRASREREKNRFGAPSWEILISWLVQFAMRLCLKFGERAIS